MDSDNEGTEGNHCPTEWSTFGDHTSQESPDHQLILDLETVAKDPARLIPERYPGNSLGGGLFFTILSDMPVKILMYFDEARQADLQGYEWLLRYGSSKQWYEKPSRCEIQQLEVSRLRGEPQQTTYPRELTRCAETSLSRLDTVKVWASASLTTPRDPIRCISDHCQSTGYPETCRLCTEAYKDTELVYCVVFETRAFISVSGAGSLDSGFSSAEPLYSYVRCGSREAAVKEVLFAVGLNGWTVAFSCVFRLGESFEDSRDRVEKVDNLCQLTWESADSSVARIFY
jgi:hypothetical protein